jgi:hypothetical protein
MKILNVTWVFVAVTIIALGGIVVTAGAPSLLVQLTSATDVTTTTMGGQGGEEEGAATTDSITTINNISNAVLVGPLFSFGEGEGTEVNVKPINETYSVISYSGNRIIMPPNTTGVVINATEAGNLTVNLRPNGLSIEQGQAIIVTEEDGAAAPEEEEENATITFVMLSHRNPDGTGSGTSVTFFSTNSTGQLAFLDNMVAIGQTEFSPEGARFREWEWKGADFPFGNEGDDSTTIISEELALTNTTMTNATAADTNATAATDEEGEGNEEGENPNEFENCVVPPGRDPGDVGC